jgi:hypothetical protein
LVSDFVIAMMDFYAKANRLGNPTNEDRPEAAAQS